MKRGESFYEMDRDVVAGALRDGCPDGRIERELVGAVAEGHERAGEGVPVDGAAHLDGPSGRENSADPGITT